MRKKNRNYKIFKVALAKDGQTIAVASPSTTLNSEQYGAIFVYVWIDDVWTAVAEILYGQNNIRRLGLGGIAIDAGLARVDAKDQNENLYSFVVSLVAAFSRKSAFSCNPHASLLISILAISTRINVATDMHFPWGSKATAFAPSANA